VKRLGGCCTPAGVGVKAVGQCNGYGDTRDLDRRTVLLTTRCSRTPDNRHAQATLDGSHARVPFISPYPPAAYHCGHPGRPCASCRDEQACPPPSETGPRTPRTSSARRASRQHDVAARRPCQTSPPCPHTSCTCVGAPHEERTACELTICDTRKIAARTGSTFFAARRCDAATARAGLGQTGRTARRHIRCRSLAGISVPGPGPDVGLQPPGCAAALLPVARGRPRVHNVAPPCARQKHARWSAAPPVSRLRGRRRRPAADRDGWPRVRDGVRQRFRWRRLVSVDGPLLTLRSVVLAVIGAASSTVAVVVAASATACTASRVHASRRQEDARSPMLAAAGRPARLWVYNSGRETLGRKGGCREGREL